MDTDGFKRVKRVSEENPIMNLTLKFKVKRFNRTRVADWELVGPGFWPSHCPSTTLVLVQLWTGRLG